MQITARLTGDLKFQQMNLNSSLVSFMESKKLDRFNWKFLPLRKSIRMNY